MCRRILRAVGWRVRSRLALVGARRSTSRRLAMGGIRRVLIVCYGNIYRSPFVAAQLEQRLGESIEVRSVGLYPKPGRKAETRHVTMSRRFGLDLSGHRSTVLGDADLDWADAVILMDRHNWQAVVSRGVDPGKILWLGALDGHDAELPDPYRLKDEDAFRVLQRLHECSENLASRLAQQAPHC